MDQIPSKNVKFSSFSPINFGLIYKKLEAEGQLAYEYNPFRNLRAQEILLDFKDRYYTLSDFYNYVFESCKDWEGWKVENQTLYTLDKFEKFLRTQKSWESFDEDLKLDLKNNNIEIPPEEEAKDFLEAVSYITSNPPKAFYEDGQLVDFISNQLTFDIQHPVEILPQYSYDGSVNLILNDGINQPRLINSRFSPVGNNKYRIVDRVGDNDTNIYDIGSQFDIDTSLYKRTITIPKISFDGIISSGSLPVGNYHFYFKYKDADGNETDFIGESGLVSIFIGTSPQNIHSGFRDQNSFKGCSITLTNLDSAYQYISVYYTRVTSDIHQNAVTQAYKIEQKYIINNNNVCTVIINGYEDKTEIPLEEINTYYEVVSDAFTQTACQNRLFLANVHKPNIPYKDLTDIALRFTPRLDKTKYDINDEISEGYAIKSSKNYYDPRYIYSNTGYFLHEIYRFGIVFILNNNTLSPVFNTRGIFTGTYSEPAFYDDDGKRSYISYNEQNYLVSNEDNKSNSSDNVEDQVSDLENVKGVFYTHDTDTDTEDAFNQLYKIKFTIQHQDEVIKELKKLGIRGFFIVRQKRIPTILTQAFAIGVDRQSHLPAIPVSTSGNTKFIIEKLLNDNREISHNFSYEELESSHVTPALICPDYDVDPSFYNSIFNGDSYTIEPIAQLEPQLFGRQVYSESIKSLQPTFSKRNLISIEDNVKLVGLHSKMFSSRAGEAEEGFRFEYIKIENNSTNATNIVRGSFGPYIGIDSDYMEFVNNIVNIRIPGYSVANMSNYFTIRYNDKSSYQAISNRFDINDLSTNSQSDNTEETPFTVCGNGDCYISLFTHRVNRNFQDPSAPTNGQIVDPKCWKDHYRVTDGVINVESFDEINLGDLNAKNMGLWLTIPIKSSKNLCIRALDESIPDEVALFGHPRGFYPYFDMLSSGSYKIPEALCFNDGFSKGLSERYNFEVPDVPYIKNEYTNRIIYSDIHITDSFSNGFRTFRGGNFRDYPKTYGSITKILELNGSIVCVFEHGVVRIPVNERAAAGDGPGGTIYINTNNVLPDNPLVLSYSYGSQWRDSIIKTPTGIYGVDTQAKKIWRTDGTNFECISDFKIQEFLNNNIILKERELTPIIGIRNVKTHYNAYKHDIMFTFYNNPDGFQQVAWNLCFNELFNKWVTFYSWLPSYSENISNQFFSFDQETSKDITNLAISRKDTDFSMGLVLENNVIEPTEPSDENDNIVWKSTLSLVDPGDKEYEYKLERNIYNNMQYFNITDNILSITKDNYNQLLERYKLSDSNDYEKQRVIYLTISVQEKQESVANSSLYTITLILKDNLSHLTTDFWKHGQAGIIDIADRIKPTYWYGKQHPFEFEFIVADNPGIHKIFDNLQIIGNKAVPESFHYEIVGESFMFADEKQNVYVRQERTKDLYQALGSNITYNKEAITMPNEHHIKSLIFPLYYSRIDSINDIEDYYRLATAPQKDYGNLSGSEIVYYKNLNEYRIWEHSKAIDVATGGRLRGNMNYQEDLWNIQINPIVYVEKNEDFWEADKIPIVLGNSPIPEDIKKDQITINDIPQDLQKYYIKDGTIINISNDSWGVFPIYQNEQITIYSNANNRKEVKVKDKYIKIRVRYSGNDLAVITALKTLYSISYA